MSLVVAKASKETPVMVNATKTQVELNVERETWLEPESIKIVKIVSKRTELLCFEQTQTVSRQRNLMIAKGVMAVRPNVPLDKPSHQTNHVK